MTARQRLVASSAVAAVVLALLAWLAIGVMSGAGLSAWSLSARAVLASVPAAGSAAAIAAWSIVGWWQAVKIERRWSAAGMAMRMVVMAFLLFPMLAALWVAMVESVAFVVAPSGESYAETMGYVPAIAVYAVLFGVVLGGLPSLLGATLLCRRFLRAMPAAGVLR